MEVSYINLAKRTDRNAEFLRRNNDAANCVRIDAPEGKLLRTAELISAQLIAEPLRDYSPGAVACALSHRELWQRAVSSRAMVTIAEDDAVLNRRFSDKAAAVLGKLPPDWDLIFWGWNFDSILHCEIIPGLKETVMNFDATPLRGNSGTQN